MQSTVTCYVQRGIKLERKKKIKGRQEYVSERRLKSKDISRGKTEREISKLFVAAEQRELTPDSNKTKWWWRVVQLGGRRK